MSKRDVQEEERPRASWVSCNGRSELTGSNVVKKAEASGLTMADFLRKSDAGEIDEPSTSKKRKSTAKIKTAKAKTGDNSDSELSDLESPPETGKKTKTAAKKRAETKAKATLKTKAKAKSTKADPKNKAKNAKDAKSKTTKTKLAKGKTADTKVKPAPKKKVVPEPPHPEIKNVDTRLSFEEAEQRMFVSLTMEYSAMANQQLREFVVRFRGILGLPDRSLAPLDDFDHPLPETTVRSVAGGLLDLIINDGGRSLGTSPDLIETIEDLREELRHYADLRRFAKIFSEIQEHFDVKLAPEPSNESRERNERALREILDLEEGDATPTWATEAPRRGRVAASRIPSATEVVRMLIGLCDYVIELDAVRQDMDPNWQNSEAEYRREAARLTREENKRWEAEKKKIMAARVRCTSAAATRANKQLMDTREAEHRTTLAGIELVPRTVAARKLTRFQALGLDAGDRKYFFLTPRLIEEERYRPSGWARGLYIFGRGFSWDDSLPQAVERWMRVDSSAELLKLGHWLGYDLHRKLGEMAKEGFWPGDGESTLNLTAEEHAQALDMQAQRDEAEREREREREAADDERPPRSKVNGISQPQFNDTAASSSGPPSEAGSEAGSVQSELSSAPSQPEDLLALLDAEYQPSYDKMYERYRIVSDVAEVRQFIEQLELRNN